jgi:hypothetical protein
MFGQSFSRVRDWWEANTVDILGGDLPSRIYAEDIEYFRSHPHRQMLGGTAERRGGSVMASALDCAVPSRSRFELRHAWLVG